MGDWLLVVQPMFDHGLLSAVFQMSRRLFQS